MKAAIWFGLGLKPVLNVIVLICSTRTILNIRTGGGSITFHKADLRDVLTWKKVTELNPCIIFGFPPCDALTNAGSRHWNDKFDRDPTFLVKAMQLVKIVPYLANKSGVPYFFENPVGLIPRFYKSWNFRFDPCDYAGYLPEDDKHPRYPQYIPARDRYNKSTCIWSGNGFVRPKPKYLRPVERDNPGWRKLGGKSALTKKIRSETPRGFAIAVFQANKHFLC